MKSLTSFGSTGLFPTSSATGATYYSDNPQMAHFKRADTTTKRLKRGTACTSGVSGTISSRKGTHLG